MHPIFHPNGKVRGEDLSITQLTLVLKGLIMFKTSLKHWRLWAVKYLFIKKMYFVKGKKLKNLSLSLGVSFMMQTEI